MPESVILQKNGLKFKFDKEKVQSALDNGFSYESAPEQRQRISEEVADSPSEKIGAVAAGAARALTFGLSDVAARSLGSYGPFGTGSPADYLKELKEGAPAASAAGEIAGSVAPLLFPGSAISQVAGALVHGSAKAGLKLSTALASAMGNSLKAKAAAAGIAGAAEGALVGLGAAVSETALENNDLNAEKIIAHVGPAALFGGAVSAGLTAGVGAINLAPSLFDGVKKFTTPVVSAAAKKSEDAIATMASSLSGSKKDTIKKFIKIDKEGAKLRQKIVSAEQGRDEAARAISNNINTSKDIKEKIEKQIFGRMKIEEVSKLIPESMADSERAFGVAESLLKEQYRKISRMYKDKEIYGDPLSLKKAKGMIRTTVRELKSIMKSGDSESVKTTKIFDKLNILKQKYGPLAKFNTVNRSEMNTAEYFRDIAYEQLRSNLEDTSIYFGGADLQRDMNKLVSKYIQEDVIFNREFTTHVANSPAGPVYRADPAKVDTYLQQITSAKADIKHQGLINHMNNELAVINEAQKYFNIEKNLIDLAKLNHSEFSSAVKNIEENIAIANEFRDMSQQASSGAAISGGVAGAAAGGIPGAILGATIGSPAALAKKMAMVEMSASKINEKISSGVASFLSGVKNKTKGRSIKRNLSIVAAITGEHINDDKKRIEKFVSVSSDPIALATRTVNNAMNAGIDEDMAVAISQTASRAASFLASKAPKVKDGDGGLRQELPVSKIDLMNFKKYEEAIDDPTNAFKSLANLSLMPYQVEVLRQVYPEMYSEAVTAISEQLAVMRKPLDERQRIQLGLFLGAQLSPLQGDFQVQQQNIDQQQPQPSTQTKNLGKPLTPNQQEQVFMSNLSAADRLAAR